MSNVQMSKKSKFQMSKCPKCPNVKCPNVDCQNVTNSKFQMFKSYQCKGQMFIKCIFFKCFTKVFTNVYQMRIFQIFYKSFSNLLQLSHVYTNSSFLVMIRGKLIHSLAVISSTLVQIYPAARCKVSMISKIVKIIGLRIVLQIPSDLVGSF